MENELYLHIGNGGIKFSVTNDCGATLNISATHFGNQTNSMKIHVAKESLRDLGEMLLNAYNNAQFDKDYINCAKYEKKKPSATSHGIEPSQKNNDTLVDMGNYAYIASNFSKEKYNEIVEFVKRKSGKEVVVFGSKKSINNLVPNWIAPNVCDVGNESAFVRKVDGVEVKHLFLNITGFVVLPATENAEELAHAILNQNVDPKAVVHGVYIITE